MRYFSMFSGIGGFELGISRAMDNRRNSSSSTLEERRSESDVDSSDGNGGRSNSTCVGYSEIDKYAIKVYERQFNGHRNYGDATTINPRELSDFDLLVGGFPCQAFSVAGKRQGFNDTRGTLFFDIARILSEKRPRHLVLENVKGLLSHDRGKTFQTILGVLSDLGYRVEWQILNSKNFGVPQNRERIFIIGHLREECGRKVFPIIRGTGKGLEELTQHADEASRVYSTTGMSRTIKDGGGMGAKTGLYPTGIDLPTKQAKHTDQARTIQARYHKGYSHRTAETTNIDDGTRIRIRRLTPKECERLQGFPDNWTELGVEDCTKEYCDKCSLLAEIGNGDIHTIPEKISDTQRYKMCGNAVTVNVIEELFKELVCLRKKTA